MSAVATATRVVDTILRGSHVVGFSQQNDTAEGGDVQPHEELFMLAGLDQQFIFCNQIVVKVDDSNSTHAWLCNEFCMMEIALDLRSDPLTL